MIHTTMRPLGPRRGRSTGLLDCQIVAVLALMIKIQGAVYDRASLFDMEERAVIDWRAFALALRRPPPTENKPIRKDFRPASSEAERSGAAEAQTWSPVAVPPQPSSGTLIGSSLARGARQTQLRTLLSAISEF
jgi:hypothetical protein